MTLPAVAVSAAVQARLGVSLPHRSGRAHVPPRAPDALQAIGVRRSAYVPVRRVDGAGGHIGWPCLSRRFYGAPSVRGEGFWRYSATAGDKDEAEQDAHRHRVPMGEFGGKVNGWEAR